MNRDRQQRDELASLNTYRIGESSVLDRFFSITRKTGGYVLKFRNFSHHWTAQRGHLPFIFTSVWYLEIKRIQFSTKKKKNGDDDDTIERRGWISSFLFALTFSKVLDKETMMMTSSPSQKSSVSPVNFDYHTILIWCDDMQVIHLWFNFFDYITDIYYGTTYGFPGVHFSAMSSRL